MAQARNKKRRAGRYGKVKLKNRSYAKFIPPQIQDPVIRANWDPRKSPAFNMNKIGFMACSNDVQSHGTSSNGNQSTAVPLFDIPESDIMAFDKSSTSSSRPSPLMSLEQQQYISRCIAKYGDNYSKMARDIKLNNMQHNENQLRKIAARFILLTPEQRKVDLPQM